MIHNMKHSDVALLALVEQACDLFETARRGEAGTGARTHHAVNKVLTLEDGLLDYAPLSFGQRARLVEGLEHKHGLRSLVQRCVTGHEDASDVRGHPWKNARKAAKIVIAERYSAMMLGGITQGIKNVQSGGFVCEGALQSVVHHQLLRDMDFLKMRYGAAMNKRASDMLNHLSKRYVRPALNACKKGYDPEDPFSFVFDENNFKSKKAPAAFCKAAGIS